MNSFNVGDLVVLTGEGCNQPAPELMAIWRVERLTDTYAAVKFDPDVQIAHMEGLERKRYPLDWLILYKRGHSD
uniref:Uncharacterized protein n=1 Tax=Oscillatoriales cyanobacterium SpSt-402 TaxID=2282168 RepID=A0A832H2Z8_9CYAN